MTILEALNKLPIKYRDKAIENAKRLRPWRLHEDVNEQSVTGENPIAIAIDSAFSWSSSPEGHDYWSEVKRSINYKNYVY